MILALSSSFPYFFLCFVHLTQILVVLLLLNAFSSSAGAEPASAGGAPADPDHLIEDGEEGDEAESTEPISKEEAAERLMVGSEADSPGTSLVDPAVTLMWPPLRCLCCRRRRRLSQSSTRRGKRN